MPDAPKSPKKPKPLYTLLSGRSKVEYYDFTQLVRSNPPLWNQDGLLLKFEIKNPRL